MRWFPPRATKLQELGPVPFVVGFVLLIGVAFGLAVYRFSAGGKAVQRNRWQRITEAPEEALEALKHIETTDVEELFRRLASEARVEESKGRRVKE